MAKIAEQASFKNIVSHRGGETLDDFISDLGVGIGAWGIKVGAAIETGTIGKIREITRN